MKFIDWSFSGDTRWVILIGPLALKFTWLREFWRGNVYYFSGVHANLREYRRYKRWRTHIPMAPTYLTLGFLNIQRRGQPITQAELDASGMWRGFDMRYLRLYDSFKAANYCRINGRIVQCDYGKSTLDRLLERHFERGIPPQDGLREEVIESLDSLNFNQWDKIMEWVIDYVTLETVTGSERILMRFKFHDLLPHERSTREIFGAQFNRERQARYIVERMLWQLACGDRPELDLLEHSQMWLEKFASL